MTTSRGLLRVGRRHQDRSGLADSQACPARRGRVPIFLLSSSFASGKRHGQQHVEYRCQWVRPPILLATNSNNIANVYTPGYSRETVELSGGPGASPVSGVSVSSISRQTDASLAQLDSALSASAGLETREANLSQIHNLLADEEAGLAPLMEQFFAAIEGVASQPGDPAARESMLGTAESLAGQLNAFAGYLDEMDAGVNAESAMWSVDINNATTQIASLNEQISMTRARTGEEPLGLLDQRDQAVTELQSLVGVDVQEQDGRLSISLNGQLLVNGEPQP